MSEFHFNEHDVCLNPNQYTLIDKKPFNLTIMTAFARNGWVSGVKVFGNDWGMSCGCWYDGKSFPTEKEAFHAGLEIAKVQRLDKEHLAAIAKHNFFPTEQQLELF